MTSLKAISTLSKKTKVFLVLLLLLISASVLHAETLRITVGGNNDEYITLFNTVLSSFKSVGSDEVLLLREERRQRESLISKYKTLTTESQSEKFSSYKEEETSPFEALDIEAVTLDLSQYESFLSSGDPDAYDYVRMKNSIDGIFYISSVTYDDIAFIEIFFNGKIIHSAWFNTVTSSSEENTLYTLLSGLLLGDEWHLYTLNLTPVDSTILIDGTEYAGDGYLILKDGSHTFTLSSYGHKDSVFTLILDGSYDEIKLSLEESEPFVLSFSTYPFDADIYFNGIKVEKGIMDSARVPYIITLSSDRFSQYSYQERRKLNHITLSMAPLWTESVDLLGQKKGEFYSSLFYVLLSFGGYTASNAITNYYSSTLGSFSKVVFTGCTVVSLVNLVQSAIDYYNAAQTGL